jgi:26S proteasome regulatory subunit N1
MSGHFHDFGKELGVTDPKSLKDIYKTHLENCMCYTFLSPLLLTAAQN